MIKSVDLYGHTGTITGAIWTPYGHKFEGTDDKIDMGASAYSMGVGLTGTFAVWIRSDSLVGYRVFMNDYDNGVPTDIGMTLRSNDNDTVTFYGYGTDGDVKWNATSVNVLSISTWYLIEGVIDGTNAKLYVSVATSPYNTTPWATATQLAALGASTDNLHLGIRNVDSGFDFEGLISEAWVHTRALSEEERIHRFNTTK